jgi:hypothetical protein
LIRDPEYLLRHKKVYFKLISIVLNILPTHPSSVSLPFEKEREKLINRLYGSTGSVFRDGKRIARVDKGRGRELMTGLREIIKVFS